MNLRIKATRVEGTVTIKYIERVDGLLFKRFGCRYLAFLHSVEVAQRVNWIGASVVNPHSRVLDLGCGSGLASLTLAMRGHRVTALDVDLSNSRLGRRFGMVSKQIAGDICLISWDARQLDKLSIAGPFDYVVASEIIEHILDDAKIVRDIARLLRPGGHLILTTPNKSCRGLVGDKVSPFEDGGHIRWGYSQEDLKNLFSPCSLQIQNITFLGGLFTQQYINVLRLTRRVFPRAMVISALFPVRLICRLDPLIKYEPMTICVVAQKFEG